MIAADGKDSVEARREPASALESLPPPVKPLQISLNGESAAKPEAKADGRGNWRENRRGGHPHTARAGEAPPPTPPRLPGLHPTAEAPHKREGPTRWHRAGLQTRSAATWKSMTKARH